MASPEIDPNQWLPLMLSSAAPGFSFGVIWALAAILFLLACSALISGSEIAFFSLSPAQINELRSRPDAVNKKIIHLLEIPKRLLATILISNNFVNVAIVIISTYVTNTLLGDSNISSVVIFLIQVIVVTALLLLLGEVLPKVYATQKNIELARFMSAPMNFLVKLFHPLSSLMVRSTNIIDRRLARKGYNISMSELSDAIELTADHSTPLEDKKLLQGIVKFGDIEVGEIMRSRMDVNAVDINTRFRELLGIIIEAGYSRIPVYEGTFDNVRGILYIKDLLPHLDKGDDFAWYSLLRDAFFVPENKKINDLLKEFQEKKIHLAIVVDEYGGTSGIVTLEDIIEEIVGEISDEHDLPMEAIVYEKLDDHNYLFEGKTSINDLCKILNIGDDVFDDVKGDADSLAGLLLELTGKLPGRDEKVEYRQFTFTIKAVDKRRIRQVQITVKKQE